MIRIGQKLALEERLQSSHHDYNRTFRSLLQVIDPSAPWEGTNMLKRWVVLQYCTLRSRHDCATRFGESPFDDKKNQSSCHINSFRSTDRHGQ